MIGDYQWILVGFVSLIDCVWCGLDVFGDLVIGQYLIIGNFGNGMLDVLLEGVVDVQQWQFEMKSGVGQVMCDLLYCLCGYGIGGVFFGVMWWQVNYFDYGFGLGVYVYVVEGCMYYGGEQGGQWRICWGYWELWCGFGVVIVSNLCVGLILLGKI